MAVAIYRPREAFVALDPQGVKHHFSPETPVAEGHWVLRGRDRLFETAEEHAARIGERTSFVAVLPDVEAASAAPGERRSVLRAPAGG